MIANMKSVLLLRSKEVLADGAIVEMVLWRLPKPVAASSHMYKYRLYYGRGGVRIVGYDNERLKGDHRHLDGKESRYSLRRRPIITESTGRRCLSRHCEELLRRSNPGAA